MTTNEHDQTPLTPEELEKELDALMVSIAQATVKSTIRAIWKSFYAKCQEIEITDAESAKEALSYALEELAEDCGVDLYKKEDDVSDTEPQDSADVANTQ